MDAQPLAPPPPARNDVHSRLNPTRHARILRPANAGQVAAAVRAAAAAGQRLAVAGACHAMGGQQFAEGGWLLETSRLDHVLEFDGRRGLVRCGAGVRWPALQRFLRDQRTQAGPAWAIRQKQTGADDFSLGGAVAANIHGRGLDMPPFVGDIEALQVVTPDGALRTVDRAGDPELFALVVGGYGLFGVVTEVTLRLAPRQVLQRRVRLLRRDALAAAFAQARARGAVHGDFQFAIDPASPDFMDLGVFSTYAPCRGQPSAPRRLAAADWQDLLVLAHLDKGEAFRRYSRFYLATDGQRYDSDEHQFGVYLEGYHQAVDARCGHRGSELITELYVPPEKIGDFLERLAADCRRHAADVVYGTVRQIRAEQETRLRWARRDWACVVLNLHVRHDEAGRRAARDHMVRFIDRALEFGGSFYLTYHRHARADQLRAAYPDIEAVFAQKRAIDPQGVLASDWYQDVAARLAGHRP